MSSISLLCFTVDSSLDSLSKFLYFPSHILQLNVYLYTYRPSINLFFLFSFNSFARQNFTTENIQQKYSINFKISIIRSLIKWTDFPFVSVYLSRIIFGRLLVNLSKSSQIIYLINSASANYLLTLNYKV